MITSLQFRHPRIGELVVILTVISYFAVIDDTTLPHHPMVDGWSDFIVHVGDFSALSLIAVTIWRPARAHFLRLLCVGAAIERFRMPVPGRELCLADIVGKAPKVAAGIVSFFFLQRLAQCVGYRNASSPYRGKEKNDLIGRQEWSK